MDLSTPNTPTNPTGGTSLFSFDNSMVRPWVKVGIDGLQGSGKSHTAALIAAGIHKDFGCKGPILVYDNERSAKFLRKLFKDDGIEMGVLESESLDVLQDAIKEAEALGTVLLIDSLTKTHAKLVRDFLKVQHRDSLEIQDRPIINDAWQTGFADIFVMANCHIIFTGRATTDWANEEVVNEATGETKRGFYAKGMKMMGHAQTMYEPDYSIYMERQERLLGLTKEAVRQTNVSQKDVWREATVTKDRSRALDGWTLRNPVYEDLAPMFRYLLTLPAGQPNEVTGNPSAIFGDNKNVRAFFKRRDVALEELDGLLTRALPGQKAEEKQARSQVLVDVFGTCSKTKIEGMRPEDIEAKLPAVEAWLIDLYKSKGVGSLIEDNATPKAATEAETQAQFNTITELTTELLKRKVDQTQIQTWCKEAAGVERVEWIKPEHFTDVIARLNQELANTPKPKPKRTRAPKAALNILAAG